MAFRPAHSVEGIVHFQNVKLFRRKLFTCPLPVMIEFLVSRIEDDLKEFHIATDPTHILWRTTSLPSEADRANKRRLAGHNRFEHDFMLPVVAKVVFLKQ